MERSLVPVFVLTAGIGSRLRPFTLTKPKPCLPFLNLPLFAYSYYFLSQAGFKHFLFNLHYKPEIVEKTIRDSLHLGQRIDFLDERDQLLGSGGALWNAKKHLTQQDIFLVANGDELLIPGENNIIDRLLAHHHKHSAVATLLVTDHPDLLKTLRPVWINEQHEVVGFGMEKPANATVPVHYTGYKVFDRKVFDYIPDGESNIFYDVLMDAIGKGQKVQAFRNNELDWFETGNVDDYFKATKECLKLLEEDNPYLISLFRSFGQNMREWVIEEKDGNYLFRHRDTFVPFNLQWEGVVCLGKDTKVGIKGHLKNVVTEKGAVIPDHADLENQFIFSNKG